MLPQSRPSSFFKKLGLSSKFAHSSNREPPPAPDGLYNDEAAPESDGRVQDHGWIAGLIEDIEAQVKRGDPFADLNVTQISGLIDAIEHAKTVGIDDRKLLLEAAVSVMSRLPSDSETQKKLQLKLLTLLTSDLPQPPATFLSKKLPFREADGGGNNPEYPDLGRAGQPYARTVSSVHPLPLKSLPDPGLAFDTLLCRDEFKPHPAGLSSLFFHFATLVIHNLFRTNPVHPEINDTSSYADLSPLYGSNQAEQDTVRRKDGRGLLYEDVFASSSIQAMPPGVGALLILFCRNHNYVAQKLLHINEQQLFQDPPPDDATKLREQDDTIFNQARLINCGMFKNIILSDYLAAILGTAKEASKWTLDMIPQLLRKDDHTLIDRGRGNAVSVEFNILYRWHSTLSQSDTKWTEDLIANMLPGKNPHEASPDDFRKGAMKMLGSIGKDPRKWSLGILTRDTKTQRFPDADLADLLYASTEAVAASFKSRGIPSAMRAIEILAIQHSRNWGTCSLNEFRSYFGLKPYSTFLQWNSNPVIANAAQRLYQHPDNLELYVGLHAEESKAPMNGAGLCPGYTISRAILSDAMVLVRGDRFFTSDYTPHSLTAWGYQDVAQTGSSITGLTKLLLRTLPESYTFDSVYAHFAMLTPSTMQLALERKGIAQQYAFTRPVAQTAAKIASTVVGVRSLLSDPKTFTTTYDDKLSYLCKGKGHFISLSGAPSGISRALFPPEDIAAYVNCYKETAEYLIKDKCFSLSQSETQSVDLVHDVLNFIPLHWYSTQLGGFPLKTTTNPRGVYTEEETFEMLASIHSYIFLDANEVEHEWTGRQSATTASKQLLDVITDPLRYRIGFAQLPKERMQHFGKILLATGASADELGRDLLIILSLTAVSWSKAAALVVDFYLGDERSSERQKIVELCKKTDAKTDELLVGYVREALRLQSPVSGLFRRATKSASVQDGIERVLVKQGDLCFAYILRANLDSNAFGPDPTIIDPTRSKESYVSFSDGLERCMDNEYTLKTMAEVLRVVFRLKNLRRAPGYSGQLNMFVETVDGIDQRRFIDYNGRIKQQPSSLILQYEL